MKVIYLSNSEYLSPKKSICLLICSPASYENQRAPYVDSDKFAVMYITALKNTGGDEEAF